MSKCYCGWLRTKQTKLVPGAWTVLDIQASQALFNYVALSTVRSSFRIPVVLSSIYREPLVTPPSFGKYKFKQIHLSSVDIN